jgi:hypothetical protein
MPHDQYTPVYGQTCLKCGTEERQPHSTWCATCHSAARRQAEARLEALGNETMRYRPTPQYPTDSHPSRQCGRCRNIHTQWTTREDGHMQCMLCQWTP